MSVRSRSVCSCNEFLVCSKKKRTMQTEGKQTNFISGENSLILFGWKVSSMLLWALSVKVWVFVLPVRGWTVEMHLLAPLHGSKSGDLSVSITVSWWRRFCIDRTPDGGITYTAISILSNPYESWLFLLGCRSWSLNLKRKESTML